MTLLILVACAPCPDGFVRSGSTCTPDGTADIPPLSEENFPDRYESRGCRELEDCICDDLEGDYIECDVDCEAQDWSWADGCVFDLDQAALCLSEGWTCFEDQWLVEAPESCLWVYDCGTTSASSR